MIWIVYKTTCKINNKIYVGVHKTETDEIFDGYYGNGIQFPRHTTNINNPKFPFHFAFKKYGKEQFYRETLAKFDNSEDAYLFEASIVTPEFVNRNDTYNVTVGGGRTHPIKGCIHQFDCAGNYIKTWNCAQEAAEELNIPVTSVRDSARLKVARAGFIWSWDLDINIEDYNICPAYRHYYLYDLSGNFVKEVVSYQKLKEFLSSFGSIRNLSRAIKNGYTVCNFYISNKKLDKFQIFHKCRKNAA